TGTAALADDTGLFVAALGGRPGVHTARYAGPGAGDADNVAKLLRELVGVVDRWAEFRTVIALAMPDGQVHLARGVVEGRIAEQADGDQGFGYDPVFVPDEGDGRTFAEMGSADKGHISHRGRAIRAMLELIDRLEPSP
ncbi:MAG: non-canonical purine NTP pyrophosphatase, partial [Acidimicrobiales bacterium]